MRSGELTILTSARREGWRFPPIEAHVPAWRLDDVSIFLLVVNPALAAALLEKGYGAKKLSSSIKRLSEGNKGL